VLAVYRLLCRRRQWRRRRLPTRGLIPIVSRDTSVDVNDDYEMVLEYSTIEEIKESVQNLSMNLSGRIVRLNAGSRQR